MKRVSQGEAEIGNSGLGAVMRGMLRVKSKSTLGSKDDTVNLVQIIETTSEQYFKNTHTWPPSQTDQLVDAGA